ncbi:hypothetical protein LTR53_005006 [Teratosphaeriaceae sp. CCFEE 6253]|nr:hypothetical protein LTR53_005006 [Teratosphaeriaceae sp. CCFEE 6253]
MLERPDAHVQPPHEVKVWFKQWQKAPPTTLATQPEIIDLGEGNIFPDSVKEVPWEYAKNAAEVFGAFMGLEGPPELDNKPPRCYEVDGIPEHRTNMHIHYEVPYAKANSSNPPDQCHPSFFSSSAQGLSLTPLDPASHTPLTVRRMLDKKLRWMTLGGQYDWTHKVYPSTPPPAFPADIKKLIESLFPMQAEAAIANLYSPGDTLSIHRDVSETCAAPLVSISLGCEALFLVALADGSGEKGDRDAAPTVRRAVLRLRSGDAVLMSGESRYAWHGVPRVLAATCPEGLRDWPAAAMKLETSDRVGMGVKSEEDYEDYRGWLAGKRVNLNVRQMFAEDRGGMREFGECGGGDTA